MKCEDCRWYKKVYDDDWDKSGKCCINTPTGEFPPVLYDDFCSKHETIDTRPYKGVA